VNLEAVQLALERHARRTPYQHQVEGVHRILTRPYMMLADEMGAGKTKQIIDAACLMRTAGIINRVLVLAPASVRSVWFDEELGEIAKHAHESLNIRDIEVHTHPRLWQRGEGGLDFFVSNYDWARDTVINSKPPRPRGNLAELAALCGPGTLLVADESTAVKNYKSEQTKATLLLRNLCGRVVLMNGTPISNSPADLFAQSFIMHPGILGYGTWSQFKSAHAMFGGFKGKEIIGWRDLEGIQEKMKPFVLRRLKRNCIDLPDRLEPVFYQVPLSEKSWRIYCQMRDELVAWLESGMVSVASQAAVKALRLSQITSGFVGGVERALPEDAMDALAGRPEWVPQTSEEGRGELDFLDSNEIGREKLDAFEDWLGDRLREDPSFKCVVWVRFRQELRRLLASVAAKYPQVKTGAVIGGQPKTERAVALRLVHPDSAPPEPVVVAATTGAGGTGHNFAGAWANYYMSTSYSLYHFLQSRERMDRMGQTRNIWEGRLIATGPRGQRTIDRTIVEALERKENLATWTTSAWVRELRRTA
jgi:hypothetical protein